MKQHNRGGCVYFGQDPLGRRSLLMTSAKGGGNTNGTTVAASSIAVDETLPVVYSFVVSSVVFTAHTGRPLDGAAATSLSPVEKKAMDGMPPLEEILPGCV